MTRSSGRPNPHRIFGNFREQTAHPKNAARLGIETLSNAGTIWNLISTCEGSKRNPPNIVHNVARPIGSLEYKYNATRGQSSSAAYAITLIVTITLSLHLRQLNLPSDIPPRTSKQRHPSLGGHPTQICAFLEAVGKGVDLLRRRRIQTKFDRLLLDHRRGNDREGNKSIDPMALGLV